MASYNVSKKEAAKLGIARVPTGGSSKSSSSKSSSSSSFSAPKLDFNYKPLDYSNLENLQKQYTQYAAPSQAEIGLNQQLGNLVASKELGLQGASEQPIATPFITGQSRAITNRAAIQATPLTANLQALQAQRQAAADILKSNMGFEQNRLGMQQSEQDAAYQRALQNRAFNYQAQQDAQSMAMQKAAAARSAAANKPFDFNSNGFTKFLHDAGLLGDQTALTTPVIQPQQQQPQLQFGTPGYTTQEPVRIEQGMPGLSF